MKRLIACVGFLLLTSVAWALPTVDQVEAEVRQGHYAQAESMMSEVVAAKPGSARAHYTYAELLAHNGSFSKASEEAAKAREIDPKIAFTDPEKFRSFEQSLQREQSPRSRSGGNSLSPAMNQIAPASGSSGIPGWVWLVGLAVLAMVLWRGFSRSRAATGGVPGGNLSPTGVPQGAYPYNNAVNPGAAYGPGGVQGGVAGGVPGRPGSGLLGTGLAVAGGVAGGMLIDEMLHRHSGGEGIGNLGGLDPNNMTSGTDAAAQELENRPIDFGNGGSDWDSGGGSSDGGDSGGGGGWD